jgi:hypothetical protein
MMTLFGQYGKFGEKVMRSGDLDSMAGPASFKESGSPHSNGADCHKFIKSGVSSIPTLHSAALHGTARCCLQLLNATSVFAA